MNHFSVRYLRKATWIATACLGYVIAVGSLTRWQNLRAVGLSLPQVAAFYYGAALSASIILGLSLKGRISRARAMCGTVLALVVPVAALSLTMYPEWPIGKRILGVAFVSLVAGVVYGDLVYRGHRPEASP